MKEQLVAAIERYEAQSETRGDLATNREEALKRYLGKPLGNEIEGRSTVVSRDTFDTIEWIKPQIAEIFCGGDQVVLFSPRGPEDVQAAEQETAYVNHVIQDKNNWFTIFLGWMHDAFLQRNGYVKAWWDESEDRTKEKYGPLTEDELTLLLQDESIKVVEQEQTVFVEQEQTVFGFTVTIERTKKYGCVKLCNIPPENVSTDQAARSLMLDDPTCNFVGYGELKTISQLRAQGFEVPDDISDSGSSDTSIEGVTRELGNAARSDEESEEPSMRKVWVRECWVRFDYDEDGRGELRHVIIVGTTILLNEEADQGLLVALCPTPLPHQHHGLSLYDAVNDLELIKTALLRGSLDNVYLANNGRYGVDEDKVNLDDMLVSRPGGLVRTKGSPLESIAPLNHSTNGQVAIPMLDYADRIKQQRTGINEQSQGLDSNTINKNTPFATTNALMTAAQQRIKFIARIFAETGVKSLFHLVHALTLKHSRQQELIELRNQWVPVDPRSWAKRKDMQISVGLGAGDKSQQIMFLDSVLQKQMLAVQAGLSSPPKIYNALKRLTQLGGYKDPNEFWDDPATTPPKPPQPNPEVEKEKVKAEAQMQLEQGKGQLQIALADRQAQHEGQLEQMRASLKQQEMQANFQLQASNDQRDAERELMRAQYQAQMDQQKLAMEQWAKQLQFDMEKYKADLQSATQLQIAELNARVSVANKAADIEKAKESEAAVGQN